MWLIPLSSGNTSVGIVAEEGLHPFARYSDYGKALGWIEEHEPVLARALARRAPLDFKSLRGFSYGAARVFGPRWACVGEAGVFTDPFYSPGSDFIAIGNTMVSRMIALDREGSFDEALAARYEELYFVLYEIVLEYYRGSYPLFGTARVMTAKHVWDWCLYWSFTAPLFFNGVLAAQARLEAPTAGAVLTAAAAKGPSALRAGLAAFLTEPTTGGS